MRKFIFALALIFAVPAHADVLVGVGSPMTGSVAMLGEYMVTGIKLAAADINESGGILGQKIKLDAQDDACEPKQAVNIANKFVTEKAKLVIGHVCSSPTMATSMIYSENNMIQIEPVAMLEEITTRRLPGIFRISAANGKSGEYIGNQIADRFAPKRVAIVMEKRAITQELAAKTKAQLSSRGIKDIQELTFSPAERDFRVIVNRLMESKPDVVFIAGYTLEAASLVRQARESKLQLPFVGYETMASEDFANVVGPKEDKVFFIDYVPVGEIGNKLTQTLAAKKIPHDSLIYQGYAAMQVYAEAVRRAGRLETAAIIKSLQNGSFETAVGKIEFDENGDVKNPQLKFFQWKNGQRIELK